MSDLRDYSPSLRREMTRTEIVRRLRTDHPAAETACMEFREHVARITAPRGDYRVVPPSPSAP